MSLLSMSRSLTAPALACLLGFLLTPAPAAAQTDAGALRVLVTDQSQAIVPGATVEVTNTATNVRLTDVSDTSGYATFAPLPRGVYAVKVTLEGFRTVVTTAETVEVVSGNAVIQTEDGSLGQVIKGEVAVELPPVCRTVS